MAYYWIKYRIGSRSSSGGWKWRPLGEYDTRGRAESAAEHEIDTIFDEESYGEESASRSKYTVEDWVPGWVIAKRMADAESRMVSAGHDYRFMSLLLSSSQSKPCPQCHDAGPGIFMPGSKGKPARRVTNCPTCGRSVMEDTLPYLLPPEQKAALKLLGILVNGGRQPESRKWPARSREANSSGISPIQWLIDLGLAGGSSSSENNFKTEWYATDKGELEWERQKHRVTKRNSGKKG